MTLFDPFEAMQSPYPVAVHNLKNEMMMETGRSADACKYVRSRMIKLAYCVWRDGPLCHWCGEAMAFVRHQMPRGRYAAVEHLTPRKFGGSDSVDNLVLACMDCNSKRGHSSTAGAIGYIFVGDIIRDFIKLYKNSLRHAVKSGEVLATEFFDPRQISFLGLDKIPSPML